MEEDIFVEIAPKDTHLEFKNYKYFEPAPFICYGDFEAMLVPESEIKTRHVPIAAGLYIHAMEFVPYSGRYYSWSGQDCVAKFLSMVVKIGDAAVKEMKKQVAMTPWTHEQWQAHMVEPKCWICGRDFELCDIRAADHNHWTGEYRGAAHPGCNVNYKDFYMLPVFFHNLSGYDGHMLIKEIAGNEEKYGKLDVLPRTKENYISFSLWRKESEMRIRFVDTYRFMSLSLDILAKNLKTDKHILRKEFPNDEDFQLVTQKGHFPYEWLSSEEKLDQTTLPSQEEFYNKFTESGITNEDYAHAQLTWQHFGHRTMREYLMLYLRVDVCLLVDVFEAFRKQCLNVYGLDPAYYFTAPSLAMDAALKLSQIQLQMLMDVDMLHFFEESIRGGISQCSGRFAKANVPGSQDFETDKPPMELAHLDANNLYGWAMSQPLPYDEFEWVPRSDWHKLGREGADYGYFMEVDMEYPEELYDLHGDFPLAPEHRVPPTKKKEEKLMCTFFRKEHYVLHGRLLELYWKLGMKITRIHRVVRFRQKPWMAGYIDKNTRMRQETKDEFEKSFFKLMNNSVFGKTIENVRKRKRVKVISEWSGRSGASRLIASPQFHSHQILDENSVIIELRKTQVCLSKPIYIGATVLDLAKYLMYDFHYNFVKKVMPETRLLYTDTDSFLYLFTNNTLSDLIRHDPDQFDTSSYPKDHPLYSKKNDAVIGKMKDEAKGKRIRQFVGVRSKMYAYEVDGKLVKRAKGIREPVIRHLTFGDYSYCLYGGREERIQQWIFRSRGHDIFTELVTKIGLSAKDDKRYICPEDVTRTLPWGPNTWPSQEES